VIALAGSVALASLLGSPHCAGMCGGFVCLYAGQTGTRRLGPHVAYHLGRVVTYLALGAVAGALGSGVERMGAALGVARAAAIVAGTLMVVSGAWSLTRALAGTRAGERRFSFPARWIAPALAAVRDQTPVVRAGVVGLVTTLLPCGWLYAFVAVAAGAGSPAGGLVVMAAFWLGTLPVLAGLGVAAHGVTSVLRRRLPVVTATLLIAIGTLTLAGKMRPSAVVAAPAPSAAVTSAPSTLPAGGLHVCH
jgi:sulfite exporter TauE/SafE